MKDKQKAFTLVEMMVVVALISILLVLTITNAKKQRMISRDNVRVADIKTMRLALEDYKLTCGQYPPKFELNAHNASGKCDAASNITLGDFIKHIPKGPIRTSELYSMSSQEGDVEDSHTQINNTNGYFYAGLSSSLGGKCYDYHIAAELEQSVDNGMSGSHFLKKDHDADLYQGKYNKKCNLSANNFDADNDDSGLYDFKSTKSF